MTPAPRIHPALALTLALAAVPACDASFETHGELSRAVTCPTWECGSNSAEINDLPIGELHLTPGQNTGNVSAWNARIIGFLAPPATPGGSGGYTLHVDGGRFSATKGPTTLTGSALLGSLITIENTGDGTTVDVIIHDHDTILSWTTSPFATDRYVLVSYNPALALYTPVCTDAEDTSADSAWAVLVAGERYSWSDKSVLATAQAGDGWFNIACEGNGLYKMKLMGYDPRPTAANPHQTTAEQRQATLKMVTADYCGTGTSFTETGTSLHWVNQPGWSDNGTPPASTFESFWGPNGALCLDAPRLGMDELQAIEDECASVGKVLPLCDGFAGAYEWVTENPQ